MPFESHLLVSRELGGLGVESDDEPSAWTPHETREEAEAHNVRATMSFITDISLTLSLGKAAEEGLDFATRVVEVDEVREEGNFRNI